MVGWNDVGQVLFWVAILGYAGYRFWRSAFAPPPKQVQALATKLGLRHERNVWKGTDRWVGTWDRLPVEVALADAEEPRIEVGVVEGKKARWMALDRKVEDLLTPLKGEPAPVATGDARFDARYNLRLYEGTKLAEVTPEMRALLLQATPESVLVAPRGVEYLVGGDRPSAPKARLHLDAATGLARMAGITPPMVKEATP